MGSFDTLLDLQQLDTSLTQLNYRKSHLPEQEQLNDVLRRLNALSSRCAPVLATRAALDARQSSLEGQIHEVDAKIDAANKQLYGGAVTSSRELQALEADVASLKRYRSELEDTEIEVLMEREPVDAEVLLADAEQHRLDAEAAQCRVAVAEAAVAIDKDVTDLSGRRSGLVAMIEPRVLANYDAIRTKNNGVGAARLEHGTCMSCRLKLSAVHLDALRKMAETAMAFCDQCGSILVR